MVSTLSLFFILYSLLLSLLYSLLLSLGWTFFVDGGDSVLRYGSIHEWMCGFLAAQAEYSSFEHYQSVEMALTEMGVEVECRKFRFVRSRIMSFI